MLSALLASLLLSASPPADGGQSDSRVCEHGVPVALKPVHSTLGRLEFEVCDPNQQVSEIVAWDETQSPKTRQTLQRKGSRAWVELAGRKAGFRWIYVEARSSDGRVL